MRKDCIDGLDAARLANEKRPRLSLMPPHGGAAGSGGPKGPDNGNYKHGRYTAEAIASRRWLRQCIRDVRALTKRLRQSRGPVHINGGCPSAWSRTLCSWVLDKRWPEGTLPTECRFSDRNPVYFTGSEG